jgi:hypothetical protein
MLEIDKGANQGANLYKDSTRMRSFMIGGRDSALGLALYCVGADEHHIIYRYNIVISGNVGGSPGTLALAMVLLATSNSIKLASKLFTTSNKTVSGCTLHCSAGKLIVQEISLQSIDTREYLQVAHQTTVCTLLRAFESYTERSCGW